MDCSRGREQYVVRVSGDNPEAVSRLRSDLSEILGGEPQDLTTEEQKRIVEGEPYCFRCGKPASSFIAGAMLAQDDEPISPAEYIRREEGTYNPDTNRFACDACYIAIGTPSANAGWRAP